MRNLAYIKKLDDCFGQFLVLVSCVCGASPHIEPEARAHLVGVKACKQLLEGLPLCWPRGR